MLPNPSRPSKTCWTFWIGGSMLGSSMLRVMLLLFSFLRLMSPLDISLRFIWQPRPRMIRPCPQYCVAKLGEDRWSDGILNASPICLHLTLPLHSGIPFPTHWSQSTGLQNTLDRATWMHTRDCLRISRLQYKDVDENPIGRSVEFFAT